MDWDVTLLVKE